MKNPLETQKAERESALEVEFRRKSRQYGPEEILLCGGRKKRWARFFKDGNELISFMQSLEDPYNLTSRTIKYKTKKDKKIFVLEIQDSPYTTPVTDYSAILGFA